MGNTGSSSGFLQRENDGAQQSNRGPAKKLNDEGEETQSSTMGSALKVGAAAAGTALLALGAWSLASSSASADSERGKGTVEQYEASGVRGHSHRESGGYRPEGFLRSSYSDRLGCESGMIKIMSYNVWFRDVALYERMEAIGSLIQKNSPDVILFQEVTPTIYDIFQNSNWWEAYNCSVSPEKASRRKYFCMLLSKLPVAGFSAICFDNSRMGRELCRADIQVGLGKKLVIATSHLESPTPPEMHSIERVAQAKVALKLLESFPNVIFGGDMNWDEDLDGPFPLHNGWNDAWPCLWPGESGWTYDTNSNPMLLGNRPVQKRLDRFICKLRDFEVMSVELIGTETIPDVGYWNKRKKLPVLPSDHYGLLLEIGSVQSKN